MLVLLRGPGDGSAVEEIKSPQGLEGVDGMLEVILGEGRRLELKLFGCDQ